VIREQAQQDHEAYQDNRGSWKLINFLTFTMGILYLATLAGCFLLSLTIAMDLIIDALMSLCLWGCHAE
jgi:hypothetical protein